MANDIEKPTFIIDYDDTSAEQLLLLTNLEAGINTSPELYREALDVWKMAKDNGVTGAAIAKAIDFLINTKSGISGTDFGRAYDIWTEFMKSRADLLISFDDYTDVTLEQDPDILAAKAKPEKNPVEQRDKIRYLRMRAYVGRVALIGAKSGENPNDQALTA